MFYLRARGRLLMFSLSSSFRDFFFREGALWGGGINSWSRLLENYKETGIKVSYRRWKKMEGEKVTYTDKKVTHVMFVLIFFNNCLWTLFNISVYIDLVDPRIPLTVYLGYQHEKTDKTLNWVTLFLFTTLFKDQRLSMHFVFDWLYYRSPLIGTLAAWHSSSGCPHPLTLRCSIRSDTSAWDELLTGGCGTGWRRAAQRLGADRRDSSPSTLTQRQTNQGRVALISL